MGEIFTVFSDWIYGNREAYILILGLDASGKTTILNRLKFNDNRQTIPTIGFNCEHIKFGNLSFVAFDLGGQDTIRRLWHNYFENADAIVFVVDSSDKRRLSDVRRELLSLTQHTYLKDCVFLIFANKQDIDGSLSTDRVVMDLELHDMLRHLPAWKVCGSTATTGEGIDKGFEWLSNTV